MKRNTLYIVSLLTSFLFICSSCMNEDDIIRTEESQGITLRFSLYGAVSTKVTSENGEDSRNENTIQSVDVFIYPEDGDNCVFYQRISISPGATGTGTYEKVLDTTQEAYELNANYSVYVIANYTGAIPSEGLSLSSLKALSVSGLETDQLQTSFIMDGMRTMVLNDGIIRNKSIPISLKRAAAKIRVKLNYSNGLSPMPFSIVSKRVSNYATASSLIETGDTIDPQLKSMPTLTAQNTGAGDENSVVVYSYVNDWNMDANNETYLIIGAPVQDEEGAFHPNNYYKIPVNYRMSSESDNPDNGDGILRKLQRNYLYDITVNVSQLGSELPEKPDTLNATYTIAEWISHDIDVEVDGINFLYVRDTQITLPTDTAYTTLFQSSTPGITISNITVNGTVINNGQQGIHISWTPNVKAGNIAIKTSLPTNFVEKNITFTVSNEAGMVVVVTVSQYPGVYLSYDISADIPGGSQGQNNNKMFIMNSLTADFSTLKNPDEFDEDFGSGYTHYAPNPELGASYADYIRNSAVLGYPLTDNNGATIDSDENNRRISPRFMLASQHGTTTAANYASSRQKCIDYVENDETTGERYADWRMPTVAEIYMIDILQNTRASEVKKILEGNYYWSSRRSAAVLFMDPRVGSFTQFSEKNASVRCVRDVKN